MTDLGAIRQALWQKRHMAKQSTTTPQGSRIYLTDEHDDFTPTPKGTVPDEAAKFERAVRDLIRRRSAFDKQFEALDDMLSEREQADD